MVEGEGNGRVCDTPGVFEWLRGRAMAGQGDTPRGS